MRGATIFSAGTLSPRGCCQVALLVFTAFWCGSALPQWQDSDGNDWQTPVDQDNAQRLIEQRRSREQQESFDHTWEQSERRHEEWQRQQDAEDQRLRFEEEAAERRSREYEMESRLRRLEARESGSPSVILPSVPAAYAARSAPAPKKQQSAPTWVPAPPANYKGFHAECQVKDVMTDEDLKLRREAIERGDC